MSKAHVRNREEVAQVLRRHGIMPTHQRTEIAFILFTRREHLSADQILALVNSRVAEASKATVYNTLKLFVEKKLIRELVVDPAKIVYDPNTDPHPHLYDVRPPPRRRPPGGGCPTSPGRAAGAGGCRRCRRAPSPTASTSSFAPARSPSDGAGLRHRFRCYNASPRALHAGWRSSAGRATDS